MANTLPKYLGSLDNPVNAEAGECFLHPDEITLIEGRDTVNFSIDVVNVSGSDKIPRKGGPDITQSDLLVINKIDLKDLIRADLGVKIRDSKKMRGNWPFVFARARDGCGLDEIIDYIKVAKTILCSPFGKIGGKHFNL